MQGEKPTQARLDALWTEVQQAFKDSAWDAAEGLLRRFLQLVPASPLDVWDSLAFALLMQGDFAGCKAMLEPRRADPTRSFWLEHKLGDAHRGLNQLESAAECYRLSLADGSDSALTSRNLLQVLDGLDPARAVAEVQSWHQLGLAPSSALWEGAREAAKLVPGLELTQALFDMGQADGPCRQRLLEAACYDLDLLRLMELLRASETNGEAFSPWEQALIKRLQTLNLMATTNDPSVGGPHG